MNDALIITVGTLVVAALAFLTAVAARSAIRQSRLEDRLKALELRDRRSWIYIRSLIDYAYKHSDTTKFPLPQPPHGWLEEINE